MAEFQVHTGDRMFGGPAPSLPPAAEARLRAAAVAHAARPPRWFGPVGGPEPAAGPARGRGRARLVLVGPGAEDAPAAAPPADAPRSLVTLLFAPLADACAALAARVRR